MFITKEKFLNWIDHKKDLEVFNIYGTSEVSSWASIYSFQTNIVQHTLTSQSGTDWLPIGEPLSCTSIELRDIDGCNTIQEEDGKVGEIYIGKTVGKVGEIYT